MATYSQSKRVRWLGIAVFGCLPLLGTGIIAADEIHVYEGESIQAAINEADVGDEIIVHPGTYYEAINFSGKAITLRSTDPNDPSVVENTIIDGTGAYHVVLCLSGETPNTLVSGFTIFGGEANGGSWPDDSGGGVLCYNNSSPTLTNCTISGNSAGDGGGVFCNLSSPTLMNCTISGNSAADYGGGMNFEVFSSPTLTNCTISDNSALRGGGVSCVYASSPTLTNCTISGNSAADCGGGVYGITSCNSTLTNCTISGNSATDYGGGVYCYDSSSPTLTNCTIADNSAGHGGGVYGVSSSNPTLTNCILWGDSPEELYVYPASPVVIYCDVQGGWEGQGNIDADPLFIDRADDNYRLGAGSPCIDAGDNTAVPDGVTTDLDGNPRFVDDPDTEDTGFGDPPIVDMGAYEFQPDTCPADTNGDGKVNIDDLFAVLAAWGPCNDCPEDINNDGKVNIDDLFAILANWGPCP